jgi:hypothetical protein
MGPEFKPQYHIHTYKSYTFWYMKLILNEHWWLGSFEAGEVEQRKKEVPPTFESERLTYSVKEIFNCSRLSYPNIFSWGIYSQGYWRELSSKHHFCFFCNFHWYRYMQSGWKVRDFQYLFYLLRA